MRFAMAESVEKMARRWWLLVALMVPLVVGAQSDALSPTQLGAATSLPWFDMEDRLVLHVERIPDLKALLTIQALLREKSGGHSIRLLGVSASDAWFVADSLPVDGWQVLLATEPRLRLPDLPRDPLMEGVEKSSFVESVVWAAQAEGSGDYPTNPSTVELR